MTDKEYRELRTKLRKLTNKWADRMGLAWYRLYFEWVRDHKYEEGKDSRDVAGTCKASWEYREATLTFYLAKLSAFTDKEIEEVVIHELAHVLVSPIQDFSDNNASQMTEYTTTMVAKAIQWAYNDGVKGK